MEKYRQFSYTNIKNGIPFYREWTVEDLELRSWTLSINLYPWEPPLFCPIWDWLITKKDFYSVEFRSWDKPPLVIAPPDNKGGGFISWIWVDIENIFRALTVPSGEQAVRDWNVVAWKPCFSRQNHHLSLVEDVGAEELESGSWGQIFKKCSNVSELISKLRKYFDLWFFL